MNLLRANKPTKTTASLRPDSDASATFMDRRITPIQNRLSAFPEMLSHASTFPPPPTVLLSNSVEAHFKFTTVDDPKVTAYNIYRAKTEASAHVSERVAIFPQSPDPAANSIEYTDSSSSAVNYYWVVSCNAFGIESPKVLLGFGSAPGTSIITVTTAYTLKITDRWVLVDATAAPVIVTLPAAFVMKGRDFSFKKIDVSANAMTIDAAGTETIDGALIFVTAVAYVSVTIVSNGANWWII
jgi:hypothetical protein